MCANSVEGETLYLLLNKLLKVARSIIGNLDGLKIQNIISLMQKNGISK